MPLKYDIIGDWQRSAATFMQLIGQDQFTSSFSGGYKMTNGSLVRKQVRVRSRCHGYEVESSESTETCSPDEAHRGWQMANDSTRSSAVSDVFVVLFTFLAHFWLVILKSDPHWLFAKWSWFTLSLTGQTLPSESLACETSLHYLRVLAPLEFGTPTSNFRLFRAVRFLSRV